MSLCIVLLMMLFLLQLVIGYGLYGTAKLGWVPLRYKSGYENHTRTQDIHSISIISTVFNASSYFYCLFSTLNPLECLLFGALISATDPVATLAIFSSKVVDVPQMSQVCFPDTAKEAYKFFFFHSFPKLFNIYFFVLFKFRPSCLENLS